MKNTSEPTFVFFIQLLVTRIYKIRLWYLVSYIHAHKNQGKLKQKTKRPQDRFRFNRVAAARKFPAVGDDDVFVGSVEFTPSTIRKIWNTGDGAVNVSSADFCFGKKDYGIAIGARVVLNAGKSVVLHTASVVYGNEEKKSWTKMNKATTSLHAKCKDRSCPGSLGFSYEEAKAAAAEAAAPAADDEN